MGYRRLFGVFAAGVALVAVQLPVSAGSTPKTLVIGVDHVDPANQQPQNGRLYEYTDFFTRAVTVHRGDTLDFRFAPQVFHILAIAKSHEFAEHTQPVGRADLDDPNSIATGKPKIVVDQEVFFSGSGCGWKSPCNYSGGRAIPIAGPPQGSDWKVTINAPPGTYSYFCYIHPGMQGQVTVVAPTAPRTQQRQINAASVVQFQQDRAQAMAAEKAANHLRFTGTTRGERTFFVKVGLSAAGNHVAIDEMLPNRPLNLFPGDRVVYQWPLGNAHSVTFPPDAVQPFGPDRQEAEFILDPGNARPGTVLRNNETQIVDAGVRLGPDFELPTSTSWSVRTTQASTTPGTYHFNCNIHDWMQGTLNVGLNGGAAAPH
jgi:plastocyanin